MTSAREAGCAGHSLCGFVTDPCDGRTQYDGMMDQPPYRSDAARSFAG